jgi:MraZ protein
MFLGQYLHTLDAKGRLTIPARLRPPLEEGLYLTSGDEPCLVVYTPEEWHDLARKVAQMPNASRRGRAYSRRVFGCAHEAKLDSMGRVLIPSFLRDYAGIESEVLIVGVNTLIEVWSPENWQRALERDNQDLDAILDEVARMGV